MSAILPRTAWTDTAASGGHPIADPAQIVGLVPHWPGTPDRLLGLSRAQIAARLRAWRTQHLSQGWGDIGYHFAIDSNRDKWNLRGLNRTGAHAVGHNSTRFGVLWVIGIGEEPNDDMLAAWHELRAELIDTHPNALDVTDHGRLSGQATDCAGQPIRHLIDNGQLTQGGNMLTARQIHDAVWHAFNFRERMTDRDYGFPQESPANRLVRACERAGRAMVLGRNNAADIAGVKAAVAALAESGGLDPENVDQLIREATESALADISITLTVDSEEE